MDTLAGALAIVWAAGMLGLFGVGMWNMFEISRISGINCWLPWEFFRFHNYAHKEMKGSPQTRWMVIGLLGCMVWGALPILVFWAYSVVTGKP
jgi:hypothetical protein